MFSEGGKITRPGPVVSPGGRDTRDPAFGWGPVNLACLRLSFPDTAKPRLGSFLFYHVFIPPFIYNIQSPTESVSSLPPNSLVAMASLVRLTPLSTGLRSCSAKKAVRAQRVAPIAATAGRRAAVASSTPRRGDSLRVRSQPPNSPAPPTPEPPPAEYYDLKPVWCQPWTCVLDLGGDALSVVCGSLGHVRVAKGGRERGGASGSIVLVSQMRLAPYRLSRLEQTPSCSAPPPPPMYYDCRVPGGDGLSKGAGGFMPNPCHRSR